MNLAWFISRRLLGKSGHSDTRPIIFIAIGGIVLGLIVMILSICIVTGFQREIRSKVVAFGSHIVISDYSSNGLESSPISIFQNFYPYQDSFPGVRHIQQFANKPGIIKTKDQIHGVVVKGIASDFDWSYFKRNLVDGHTFNTGSREACDSVLISQNIADKMRLKTGDRLVVYFIQGKRRRSRVFWISGIYSTGLEQFDAHFIFADIRHIIKLSDWGVKAMIEVPDTCTDGRITVSGRAVGTQREYLWNWGNDLYRGPGPFHIAVKNDTVIRLIVSIPKTPNSEDTALLSIHVQHDSTPRFALSGGSGPGSSRFFTGGFEVLLNRFEDLGKMDDFIYYKVGYDLQSRTIVDQHEDIFGWLSLQDVNVFIIIALMILVAGINMISALLIMILERIRMIGMLKAMGARNRLVRRIFLFKAIYLVGIGMFIGNLLGLFLAWGQQTWQWVGLPRASYYIDHVPIHFDIGYILLLNAGTFALCTLMLMLPGFVVRRITPVQSIRFD